MSNLTPRELQRRSSAVTLSDMEVFIFPELIYALMLANLLSPRIWRWREDAWFDGLEKMKPYKRITRLKQYIMDNYIFNLDLETWGLTTQQREMARFADFVSPEQLARSNALFGYEGDKYYFDIDIRQHFGLDKYTGEIIPYWKTETVEAMDAFVHREGYPSGAGECVSLAALYAAALFAVAEVPLADIYLMATPLHSQNFIDLGDGILTNNRRLVTKNMWFNGTPLSAKARRALENEQVTIVAHSSGWIHTLYDEATIDPDRYAHFADQLRAYLHTPLSDEILGSFLRHRDDLQTCFQFRHEIHGRAHYIPAEMVFRYEQDSPYMATDKTREKLLDEIDQEEFIHDPLPSRIVVNELEQFIRQNDLDLCRADDMERLHKQFVSDCLNAEIAMEGLRDFCITEPRLPAAGEKSFAGGFPALELSAGMGRDGLFQALEALRGEHPVADLAFYAYRDLNRTEAEPFLVAAVDRNPVCREGLAQADAGQRERAVRELEEASIYDGDGRLAQPDEVWNYGRGDGAEKAVLLANLLRQRDPETPMRLEVAPQEVVLAVGESDRYAFSSTKNLAEAVWDVPPATG